MLQTTCMSPELLVNQNMSESEICGYSPGQGSPLPGETASPKSCFQQSPSLPDSGLTELNVASPKIYHPPPPCKPPGMPAPADSELSSDPPQKRYMGVRVKMPVRELLRKIRLSKGLEPAHGKEASSVKTVTKGSSGKTAEKRRAHPYTEKQLRQSKQSAGQSPKGLEDLDILVEVLQEDLNKSQLREEPLHPVPDGVWQGFSTDLQSSRWESVGSKEAAGDLQGREHSSAEHHWDSCSRDFLPTLEGRQRSSAGLHWDSCSRDFLPILQERQRSSAGLHWDSCSRDFHPILQGRQRSSPEIRWDSCSRDFLPILEGRQHSSAGLRSESCLKDFHPILQGRQRSSAGLHWNSCSRDFHPMVQERQRSSGELHSESCSRDFHPILQERQRSSAGLHSESCLKDFHPILQERQCSSAEHHWDSCSRDFHPILQGRQRSSAGLHWDSCLKDFHPILEGRQRSSAELHPESFLKDFHPIPRAEAEPSFQDEQGSTHGSSSPGMFCRTGEEGSSCWMQDALPSSQEGFPRNSPSQERFPRNSPSQEGFPRNSPSQDGFPRNSPSQERFPRNSPSQEGFPRNSPSQERFPRNSPSQEGFPRNSPSQDGFPRNSPSQERFPRNSPSLSPAEMLLGAPRGSPDPEGHSRLTPIPFPQQDLSALSFFQFQLHREESLLRNIPAEKLLAPDENGNRLLHKAVAQGRRALTFALAQRFASLNKIDEKDAEERTALHLAAEKNQHLMVSDLISLGASVNEQDSSGKTPLHLCAENGYLRVLQVLKNCKDSGVCVEVDVPDHYGLTPLHCAALAHTVLVSESHGTAGDSDEGRFLRLRKEQILEGILCLLQMGAEPELQVLNSCPTSTTCLKLEENTELMCLLQTHKPQGQDVLQESYSLLDAPRGMPGAPAAASLPELCSMASSDLFDVLLKGKC